MDELFHEADASDEIHFTLGSVHQGVLLGDFDAVKVPGQSIYEAYQQALAQW
jgi:hypothetical protein